jgi:2-polyprenyl-6-methoxyphenol hydroxylase-like FAD-dependent oxidoreductase
MAAVRMADLPATDTDVLVVGAGPTGLMAGLVLTRRGVPMVVVDQKAGPTRESRALAVQARTMEIYDQLGLAGQVLSAAYPALGMQIGEDPPRGGVSIAGWQRGETRFPGIQVFEQSANEQLLSGALAAAGTEVLWRHRLVDLVDDTDQADARVVALLDGPAGLVRVRARWCVGADGARSAVRRELDIPFEGVTDDATFWVADLRGVRGLPDKSIAARVGQATFAVAFPLGPDGHARLVALAPRDDIGQQEALAAARDDLGLTWDAVDWFSSYRVHHRVGVPQGTGLSRRRCRARALPGGRPGDEHPPARRPQPRAAARRRAAGTAGRRRPGPVRAGATSGRRHARQGHRPAVRRHRPAKPADRPVAPPGEPGRSASGAPAASHPVRQAHRRVPGPVPHPVPLRRQRRPHAHVGSRPRRGPPAAARTRQSRAAAHAGLATSHVRYPGRAA